MITGILFKLLFNNFLFFIENYRGLEIQRKMIYFWGIASIVLSYACMFLFHLSVPLFSIFVTGGIGIIINLTIYQNLELQKIYTRSLLVIFLFFFSSFVEIIPILIFRIDLDTMSTVTSSYLSLFSQVFLVIILIAIYWSELKAEFQVFWKNRMKNLDIGFKYWFLGFIVMAVSNFLIAFLLPKAVAGNEESVREIIYASPWISLISTGFLAPFIEEITFRKAFRNMISNDTLFILISGLIFGSLHVVLSIRSLYDIAFLVPYCSLGIAFGFIYAKTKTVFSSITVHTLHNLATTLLVIASSLVIVC